MIKKAEYELEPTFQCQICYLNHKIRECKTLSCNDRVCNICLNLHLTLLITENKIDDKNLLCPICSDGVIDINIIKDVVSAEDFAKFLRFKFNSWQPEENETLYFQCRNNCEFVALIDLKYEEYQCPLCNTKVCPKCYDVVHKGCSCEAFRLWKIQNGQADKAFELLLKQSQWVQCP